MFIVSEESEHLLKPAAKVEDRQGGFSCPWKKSMGICPRKGLEKVTVLPGCLRGTGPAGQPEIGLQHEQHYRDFVQGCHPSGSSL